MRRNAPLVILLYLLVFTGLLGMSGEVLALAIPLALYLLSGLWFAPQAVNLQIERTLSAERVTPNMPVTVSIRIINLGARLEELLLEDQISPALTIIKGAWADGSPLSAIPYYARNNRAAANARRVRSSVWVRDQ